MGGAFGMQCGCAQGSQQVPQQLQGALQSAMKAMLMVMSMLMKQLQSQLQEGGGSPMPFGGQQQPSPMGGGSPFGTQPMMPGDLGSACRRADT